MRAGPTGGLPGRKTVNRNTDEFKTQGIAEAIEHRLGEWFPSSSSPPGSHVAFWTIGAGMLLATDGEGSDLVLPAQGALSAVMAWEPEPWSEKDLADEELAREGRIQRYCDFWGVLEAVDGSRDTTEQDYESI